MNKDNVAKEIAEKVCGWHIEVKTYMDATFRYHEVTDECWVDSESKNMRPVRYFNPLEHENDVMVAWDIFIKERVNRMISSSFKETWWDNLTRLFVYNVGELRREIMCLTMLEYMSKKRGE